MRMGNLHERSTCDDGKGHPTARRAVASRATARVSSEICCKARQPPTECPVMRTPSTGSIRQRRPSATSLALLGAVAAVAVAGGQAARFEALPVRGQVSMITNGSTNVALQVGAQGALVVDT